MWCCHPDTDEKWFLVVMKKHTLQLKKNNAIAKCGFIVVQ